MSSNASDRPQIVNAALPPTRASITEFLSQIDDAVSKRTNERIMKSQKHKRKYDEVSSKEQELREELRHANATIATQQKELDEVVKALQAAHAEHKKLVQEKDVLNTTIAALDKQVVNLKTQQKAMESEHAAVVAQLMAKLRWIANEGDDEESTESEEPQNADLTGTGQNGGGITNGGNNGSQGTNVTTTESIGKTRPQLSVVVGSVPLIQKDTPTIQARPTVEIAAGESDLPVSSSQGHHNDSPLLPQSTNTRESLRRHSTATIDRSHEPMDTDNSSSCSFRIDSILINKKPNVNIRAVAVAQIRSQDTKDSTSISVERSSDLSVSSAESAHSATSPAYELVSNELAPTWIVAADVAMDDSMRPFARGGEHFEGLKTWPGRDGEKFWVEKDRRLVCFDFHKGSQLFVYAKSYEVARLAEVIEVHSFDTTIAIVSLIDGKRFLHVLRDCVQVAAAVVLAPSKLSIRVSRDRIAIQNRCDVVTFEVVNNEMRQLWSSADKRLQIMTDCFDLDDNGGLLLLASEPKRTRAKVYFVETGAENKDIHVYEQTIANGKVGGNRELSFLTVLAKNSIKVYSRTADTLTWERTVKLADLSRADGGVELCIDWSTRRFSGQVVAWLDCERTTMFLWKVTSGEILRKKLGTAADYIEFAHANKVLVRYRERGAELIDCTQMELQDIPQSARNAASD